MKYDTVYHGLFLMNSSEVKIWLRLKNEECSLMVVMLLQTATWKPSRETNNVSSEPKKEIQESTPGLQTSKHSRDLQ